MGVLWQMTVPERGTGVDWTVTFEDDNYTGAQGADLVPLASPIIFDRKGDIGGDSPHWITSTNTVEINVKDEAGDLLYLTGIEEQQVKCTVLYGAAPAFTGFVLPGGYSHDRYLTQAGKIEAISGIAYLKYIPYADEFGQAITTLDTPLNIIYRCLQFAGPVGGMQTACYWYPFLDNQLTALHDILVQVLLPQEEFTIDADGNALSVFQVLQLVLERFQLQLFEHNSEWYILQRSKIFDQFANTYDVFVYPGSGPPTFAQGTLQYYQNIWPATQEDIIQGTYRPGYTRSYKYVGATYNHGTPSSGTIQDTSFEILDLAEVGAGTTGQWEKLNPFPFTNSASIAFYGEGGTIKSLRFESELLGITATSFPTDLQPFNDGVFQDTGKSVEGGQFRKLQIQSFVDFDVFNGVAWNEAYFATRWNVGSYWVYRDPTDGLYKWTTNSTDINTYLLFSKTDPGSWSVLGFTTEEMLDGGTEISGPLRVELYAPKEQFTGSATPGIRYGYWDNINFEVIGADNTISNEATQTTAVYTSSSNTLGNESATFLFGDGPGPGAVHDRRMQVIDGVSAVIDLTGDWQRGLTFTVASDRSIDELWVRQRLRERRYPLQKGTYTQQLANYNQWLPWAFHRDQRTMRLTADATAGDTVLFMESDTSVGHQFRGAILPLRDIEIGIDNVEVTQVFKNAAGILEVTLRTGVPNSYVTGTQVIQYTLHSWNSQRYDAQERELRTNAREFLEGADDEAVTCSSDIKPGSEAKTQIKSFIGIPCFADIADEEIKAFMVGSVDNKFYYMTSDFVVTETSLDLTAADIIDIDRNQETGRIYGLGSNGDVWSWTSAGTDLQNEFSTGFVDLEHVFVNNHNQTIGVSNHEVFANNQRTYFYSLTGASLFDHENRLGFASLSATIAADATYAYIPHGVSFYRMLLADGTVELLQSRTGVGSAAGAVDVANSLGWRIIGSAVYQYDLTTVNNGTPAPFWDGGNVIITSDDHMDWFYNSEGTRIMIGADIGANVWSIEDGAGFTGNRSSFGVKALCTKRPYQ